VQTTDHRIRLEGGMSFPKPLHFEPTLVSTPAICSGARR
jgi:hypothetical protein